MGEDRHQQTILLEWLVLQRRNSRIHRKVQQSPVPNACGTGRGRIFWDTHVWGTEGWVGVGQVKGRRPGESLPEGGTARKLRNTWFPQRTERNRVRKQQKRHFSCLFSEDLEESILKLDLLIVHNGEYSFRPFSLGIFTTWVFWVTWFWRRRHHLSPFHD